MRQEGFEDLAALYDVMVDWEARLGRDERFFRDLVDEIEARNALDVACGTGMEAIRLGRWGLNVSACDISPRMATLAKANADRAGVELDVRRAGFGEVEDEFGHARFDLVFCLGNSLPHANTEARLRRALSDMEAVAAPGGILIFHLLNFERLSRENVRLLPPVIREKDGETYVFLKVLDWEEEQVRFSFLVLHGDGRNWRLSQDSSTLRPVGLGELAAILDELGLESECYGNFDKDPFDPATSQDLIVVARKASSRVGEAGG